MVKCTCGFLFAVTIVALFWATWVSVLSVIVYYIQNPIRFYEAQDMSYIWQIPVEWNQKPFVDMIITTNPYCPSTHPHEVFYDLYQGAYTFCDCTRYTGKVYMNDYCRKGRGGRDKNPGCYFVGGMPPVVQAQINGIRVCGQRDGSSFVSVQRNTNLLTGGSCPTGYQSCGSATPSAENTWCIDATLDKNKACPITSVDVIQTSLVPSTATSFIQKTAGSYTLLFSKESNQLPYMSSKLSAEQPCLNPKETNKGKNGTYWVGEFERYKSQCINQGKVGALDNRYNPTSLQTNERDLMSASGVLFKQEQKLDYATSVFPGSSVKTKTILTAYTRPLIQWSLQCELDKKMSREYASKLLSTKVEVAPTMKDVKGFAIASLCILCIGPIFMLISLESIVVMILVMVIVSFIASLIMINPTILYAQQYTRISSGMQQLTALDGINACLDSFSQVDITPIRKIGEINQQWVQVILIMLVFVQSFTAFMLLMIPTLWCCQKGFLDRVKTSFTQAPSEFVAYMKMIRLIL